MMASLDPAPGPAATQAAGAPSSRAGLFIDLAGVLLDATPAPWRPPGLRGGVGAALRLLDRLDYRVVVLAPCALDRRHATQLLPERIADLLARERVALTGCHRCQATRAPCADCPPAPGILMRAARDHGVVLAASWLLARDARYLAAAQQAGCRSLLLGVEGEDAWPAPPGQCDAASGPAAYQARDIVDAALAIIRLDGIHDA
jgi:D-glycero-D-manno-heptose 1,7-bisphosphate phosphatase